MTKSVEGTAQRRKLLGEIERLAEIAVFGTLSETYRTCGRAGCHCQGDGPKHGPHLNVSYRGEKGKTTGYYVPKAARRPREKASPLGNKCSNACANWQNSIRSAICSLRGRPIRNDVLVSSNSLLGVTVSVTPPYSARRPSITSYRLSAGDQGSIEGENPHPTRPPFRLSEAWNFGLALDLGNL